MAATPDDVEKKLRAIRKKLGQIDKLKQKDESALGKDEKEKIDTETALLQEATELEAQLKSCGKAVATPAPKAAAEPTAAAAKPSAAKSKASALETASPKATEPVAEPTEAEALSPMEAEKRIKNIKKKLQQIEKLKEKKTAGEDLEPEAAVKVASEFELRREIDAIQKGESYVLPAKAAAVKDVCGKTTAVTEDGEPEQSHKARDEHASARAEALQPPPGEIGLLIGEATEKRFKLLQKKLRDISKLWEQDKLDKLQEQKLQQESSLIEELVAIHSKADALMAERRKIRAEVLSKAYKDERPKSQQEKRSGWQCNECGVSGEVEDLIGSEGAMACFKCGGVNLTHFTPQADDSDDDDDAEVGEARTSQRVYCKDLKTNRQKKPPPAVKRTLDDTPPSVESAKWPELKEVLESGDRGIDKSRQKQAIVVSRAQDGPPYHEFDTVLLKCSFLTRVQLKLPPPTLASDAFQLYFPGSLCDGLLELILKENDLAVVPPGLNQLQRIRAVDLSRNKIEVLPDEDTWESISTTLELLDLSFNKLISISPLAPLKKLSQLKVDANQLTSLDGVTWSELKQLSSLSAVGNQIAEIPEAVGVHAVSLERCDISDNKLTSLPTNLGDLKKIKDFNITGNPFKDTKILKAKSLKDLKAYLSKIGSKGKK